MPRRDLVGQRFGKLVVREWVPGSQWKCDCDCGGSTVVLTANLTRKNTQSCGCIRNHMSSIRNTKHGMYGTRVYKIWHGVRGRCFAPTKGVAYQQYGARGITMDDEWAGDFLAFLRDVGEPPTDGHSLDRIDNSKGYVPGNVRWATPVEQANNKSNNRWVTYQGQRYTLAQLARKVAEECGLRPKQFSRALEKAMSPKTWDL